MRFSAQSDKGGNESVPLLATPSLALRPATLVGCCPEEEAWLALGSGCLAFVGVLYEDVKVDDFVGGGVWAWAEVDAVRGFSPTAAVFLNGRIRPGGVAA